MIDPNPQALNFLLNRRSRPAKILTSPVPSSIQLEPILRAGLRVPDHGKLEPWRLLVLERLALQRLAKLAKMRGYELKIDEEKITKVYDQFANADLAIAVIEAPVIAKKVPAIEQTYSTGAVCLQLLNAALASGWGANWLSGWASHDRLFVERGLDIAPHERVAGFIHIGTERATPPERPRPDLKEKVIWVSQ
ncbi:nitroreductase [Pseudopelagicola sp. nBUS_20]|uniref:nitroreductase family protein n=1 Tax=Pseudopelagicola sp. nBUS_20 TaxID=3395317 RepID=UPI003EB8366B